MGKGSPSWGSVCFWAPVPLNMSYLKVRVAFLFLPPIHFLPEPYLRASALLAFWVLTCVFMIQWELAEGLMRAGFCLWIKGPTARLPQAADSLTRDADGYQVTVREGGGYQEGYQWGESALALERPLDGGIGNSGLRKQGKCLVGLHWRNRVEMNSRAVQRSHEVTCPQPCHFFSAASSVSPCPIIHLKSNVGEDHPWPSAEWDAAQRMCGGSRMPHASVGLPFSRNCGSVCLPQKL